MFRMHLRTILMLFLSMPFASVTLHAQTITGVSAFWYLGGPLSDGPGCGTMGWCYYAQATWTANPGGHSGTPTWTVSTPGTGRVSLSCYTCASTLATATAASEGCVYDVSVKVTYPDGSSSPYFTVLINTAHKTTLQAGYPTNTPWSSQPGYVGFQSFYQWTLTDLCSDRMSGTDENELFGTWTPDYTDENWGIPMPGHGYNSSANYTDLLGASGTGAWVPLMQVPQTPLGSTKVYHDTPWNFYVFSTNFGSGVVIHTDTQQFFQDHGTHTAP